MKKIRKGDQVVILTGRDKGKRGAIIRMIDDSYVVVQNVNMIKRATKPNPQRNIAGGIVSREAAIHISNIALLNPATGKGERIGFKSLADGRKVRVFKKSGEVVDVK
jgi:large subunit ribosomal protein L24